MRWLGNRRGGRLADETAEAIRHERRKEREDDDGRAQKRLKHQRQKAKEKRSEAAQEEPQKKQNNSTHTTKLAGKEIANKMKWKASKSGWR